MGVPKFFGVWLRKQNFKGALKSFKPAIIDQLFLDASSLLHEAAQQVYAYGQYTNQNRLKEIAKMSKESLKLQFFNAVTDKILYLNTYFAPTTLLYIAIDGVAPFAKIIQQMDRRYKSASNPISPYFDTNALSPGTPLMNELTNHLANWIKLNYNRLAPVVIFSPSSTPGEGEHKIFDFIRDSKMCPLVNRNIIVYGMDTDLFIISVINSNIKANIYLSRDDINFVVDINASRDGIRRLMLNSPTAVQDFCFMVIFGIGNDFLPTVESLMDLNTSIDAMIKVYNDMRLPLTSEYGENILWKHVLIFFERLMEVEQLILLPENASKYYKFRSKHYDASITKEKKVVNAQCMPNITQTITKFDFNKFYRSWHKNIIELKGDPSIIRNILASKEKDTNTKSEKAKLIFDPSKELIDDNITNMVVQYLNGVQWILRYYLKGYYNVNEWAYRYDHAPLVTDFYNVCKKLFQELDYSLIFPPVHIEDKVPIHYLVQLSIILPPQSKDVAPYSIQHLFTDCSPIVYQMPYEFIVELEGRNEPWLGRPILPFPSLIDTTIAVSETVCINKKDLKYYDPTKEFIIDARYNKDVNRNIIRPIPSAVQKRKPNPKTKFHNTYNFSKDPTASTSSFESHQRRTVFPTKSYDRCEQKFTSGNVDDRKYQYDRGHISTQKSFFQNRNRLFANKDREPEIKTQGNIFTKKNDEELIEDLKSTKMHQDYDHDSIDDNIQFKNVIESILKRSMK